MWSCEKTTSLDKQVFDPVPYELDEAIKRLWIGEGSDADSDVAAFGLRLLHNQGKWLACDCRAHESVFPLMAPAYLSAFGTYYLRRLYGKTRPDHHPDCMFHSEPWLGSDRLFEIESPNCPDGYFEVTDPRPQDLQCSDSASLRDGLRSPRLYTDRLRLQLWRLMERAKLNEIAPPIRSIQPSYTHEYAKLKDAADRLHVGHGQPLSLVFETVPQAIERRSIYARIRRVMKANPNGAGQGFLAFMAKDVTKDRIVTRSGTITPRAGVDIVAGGSPYLVLVLVGADETGGLQPLKACAQPILSGRRFFPVFHEDERNWIEELISEQFRMRRAQPEVAAGLRRPLFGKDDRKTLFTHVVSMTTGETNARPVGFTSKVAGIYTF